MNHKKFVNHMKHTSKKLMNKKDMEFYKSKICNRK